VIERATIVAAGRLIELADLPPLGLALPSASGGEQLEPGMTVDDVERRLIMLTLEHTGNNKTRAAELLGISLKTLHNKLNRFKLDDAGGGE
jgi:DNA-binding NtrC family response regulator